MEIRSRQSGFTYIGALFAVVIASILTLGSLGAGSTIQQRMLEEDLLVIGNEFRDAFISYAIATPAGYARTPSTLEELVKDPRFPGVKRHLRRVYADPMTHGAPWALIPAPNGQGIAGIYSTAAGTPFKTGNFPLAYADFEQAASYGQWKFMPPLDVITASPVPIRRPIKEAP